MQNNTELLPVINLNTIVPQQEIIKLDKDTIDFSSVDLANKIIEVLLSGSVNPLEFAVKRKLIVDALEIAMKNPAVKSLMLSEIDKFGKQDCTALGAKVYVFSRPNYEYAKDPVWQQLNDKMKPFEEALKAQEKKIQSACKNNCSLMDDDGVMIASIVPAPRTESVAVSFSRK